MPSLPRQIHARTVAPHEATLRGYSLRRIETAMQRMELSFIAALPGNQRSLVPDGQPVVTEIAVIGIAPAQQ